MKKISLTYLLCCCLFIVYAQKNNAIIIGEIDSLHSKILGEERKIWIHVPENNSEEKEKYPVVYLLDGDDHFHSVVGMLKDNQRTFPEMIVVGIPNTNRLRDLTPTKGKPDFWRSAEMIANSGGGEKFMDFVEKELIPYINLNYPTEPYKMLIGHSFGGLTVINALMRRPNLFDSHVAIDPSMWWNDKKLLKDIKNNKFNRTDYRKRLYVGIANSMEEGMELANVKKDTTSKTDHIRAILDLDSFLQDNPQEELLYKSRYYKNYDHGTVPLITEYEAFHFIFDFYEFIVKEEYFSDPESDFLDKIIKHNEKLSKEFKTEIKAKESVMDGLGSHFLSINQTKKAEGFFKFNTDAYPESSGAFDSLGDFYAVTGDKEKAIENYKKSLFLNKDSISKLKLIELKDKDSIAIDRLSEIENE